MSDVHRETTNRVRITVMPFFMGSRQVQQSTDYWWRYVGVAWVWCGCGVGRVTVVWVWVSHITIQILMLMSSIFVDCVFPCSFFVHNYHLW